MNVKEFGPRVRYIWYDERTPMAMKHDDAVKLAQGDVLCHFDDDDWSAPMRLTRQLEAIVLQDAHIVGLKLGYVLVKGQWMVFDHTGLKPPPDGVIGPVGNSLGGKLLGYHDGTAMFKRSVVGESSYGTHAVSQKVVFLNLLAAKQGVKTVVMDNQGLFIYVRHDKNTWQFGKALKLKPVAGPRFFPADDLEFYRSA